MKKMRAILFCGAMGTAFVSMVAPMAHGAVITFDNLSTGVFVGSQYFASNGVVIAADNNNPTHPNVATTFNTHRTGTPDKDLQSGWAGGNLKNSDLGKLLIIAENVKDSNHNNKIDNPDDEHDGGNIYVSFRNPIDSLGFDVIDVEFATPKDSVEFFTSTGSVTVGFDQFTNPASPFYDPTVVYGDHTADRIKPITASELGIKSFNSVVFHLGECMALDNLNFTLAAPAAVTPEPGLGAIVAAAPMLLSLRRRRR